MRGQLHTYRTLALLVMLALAPACAKSTPEFDETHTLKLAVDETSSAQIVKAVDGAQDPVLWSIRCVSLDNEGVRTTSRATYDDGFGGFKVDIPDDQDTVCHIVDDEEVLISTIAIVDEGALGGVRDVFRLKEDGEATVSYDVAFETSVAEGDEFELGEAETRAELEGRWNVGCHEIRDLVNDEMVDDLDCPEEVDGTQIYMHLISARGTGGENRIAYGVWRSEGAFQSCGSTEGLDSLPGSWTLRDASAGQNEAFAWASPFAGLDITTTSDAIMEMIRSNDADGMQSYDDFALENEEVCSSEDKCTVRYYYEMRDHGIANDDALCWPSILFSFESDEEASASVWSALGGQLKPVGRLYFVEAFEYGNETYMRSNSSRLREVYVWGSSVQCKVREEFLVAVEIPDSDEDGDAEMDEDDSEIGAMTLAEDEDLIYVGTQLEARYHLSLDVASISGRHDNYCKQELGVEDSGLDSGFYSDVVFESISAE